MKKSLILNIILVIITAISGCRDAAVPQEAKHLTIFSINDPHAQIDNFSKIKQIVDREKESANVVVACSGDIFSGNPVVDNYSEKGYPIIDLMNQAGFDITAIGNHDFDYGIDVLAQRMSQADFPWVCANVNTDGTNLPQPPPYATIEKGGLKITFLGLVETNGKPGAVIPSSHPWKVKDISFQLPQDVVTSYANLKSTEGSDLYIALSHLGINGSDKILGDIQLAQNYPYFDLIIGGHSHKLVNTSVHGIPIFQSGSYLHKLGKLQLTVKDKNVESYSFSYIDLDSYTPVDNEIKNLIAQYDDVPALDEVIGYSHSTLSRSEVGCLYTDAMRQAMDVDVSFQNTGGIRSVLDEGDITVREIYEIEPFNNGAVIYTMTAAEIKHFLRGSESGFYVSGISIDIVNDGMEFFDSESNWISDNTELTVGINDYIPAVFDNYFPEDANIQDRTAAETFIYYLSEINGDVDYSGCNQYFRFQ